MNELPDSHRRAGATEADVPPELLPSSQAWGLRLVVFGLGLVMLGFAAGNVRNPERVFAEKMVATGDIHVLAKSDERAEAAFARALAMQSEEARMTLVKSDWQARSYQVSLAAPNREAALARLGALLERFQREFTQDSGRDVQTFTSSWVLPMQTPRVLAWGRRIGTAVVSMVAVGGAMMAGGVWMLWLAVKGDKRKLAGLLFQDDQPGPGTPGRRRGR
jgi:hypothetical protein